MDCALYAEPPCYVDGKSLPGEWVSRLGSVYFSSFLVWAPAKVGAFL